MIAYDEHINIMYVRFRYIYNNKYKLNLIAPVVNVVYKDKFFHSSVQVFLF